MSRGRTKGTKRGLDPFYFFIVFYYIARFFILVGEYTQKVIFLCGAVAAFCYLRFKRALIHSFTSFYVHHRRVFRLLASDLGRLRGAGIVARGKLGALGGRITAAIATSSRALSRERSPKIKKIKVRPVRTLAAGRPVRYFVRGFAAAIVLILVYQTYLFFAQLPSPTTIGKVNYPLSTHIQDRHGRLLYEVYREQNRTVIKLSDIPEHVINAHIAIEDKDFYRHNGISLISGIGRAIKDSVAQGSLQGGSTITQQLVKSALLTPERTLNRKIKEIILALWTERLYTKQEILQLYLNQVSYGGASYGVEEAARNYFKKSAASLNLAEAAFLAGLPQAPSKYSPHINHALAVSRRNDVLANMLELKLVSRDQYEKAMRTPLVVAPPQIPIKAPHFVFYVKDKLEEEYGLQQVEEGGLRVTTTLDLDIQQEAEQILIEELDKIKGLNVTNGAILVTRPSTGEILAMVGSVDYFASPSGSFNVTTAHRQPGSSIKPLMYSLALENRQYTVSSLIDDSPTVFAISSSEAYRPVNYDGKFHGRVTLRQALANSYNVPAVKVLNTIGVSNFVPHAKNMGITTWGDPSEYGLSLTLGAGEVTMTDMNVAFGVFANAGSRVDLTPYLTIEDFKGKNLNPTTKKKRQVLSEGTAYIISDILSDNVARQAAFGARSALEVPGFKVAVKTGTSNDKKDNWTIGYTPDFMVTVWVGNNDNTPMNPALTSGVTGAAPIWNRVMSYLLKSYATSGHWFSTPSDVVERPCVRGRSEYVLRGTESNAPCPSFNPSPTPRP